MDRGMISMRYAKALLAYARRHGAMDRVYADTRMLSHSYATYPALRRVLENRLVTDARKAELLDLCAGDGTASREFRRFIGLVLARRREEFLPTICLDYRWLVRQAERRLEVEVTTAVPLDAATREKFKTKLAAITGRQVTLRPAVDHTIIGGYILRWDAWRIDASVSGALTQIEKKLIQRKP